MKGAGLLIILDPGQWIASFYSLRDKKKGLCKNTLLGILKNTTNSNGSWWEEDQRWEISKTKDPTKANIN